MRKLLAVLILLAVGTCAVPVALAEPAPAATAPKPAAVPTHPPEVAFVDEGDRGAVYRKFPTGERLYTYDRDGPNLSNCYRGCASAWPPVIAPADAVPIGGWTVVSRSDGRRQWALDGRPVYLRFHDTAEVSTGDGVDGVWHFVPYVPNDASMAKVAASAGR